MSDFSGRGDDFLSEEFGQQSCESEQCLVLASIVARGAVLFAGNRTFRQLSSLETVSDSRLLVL
jgi:hypothetical protein